MASVPFETTCWRPNEHSVSRESFNDIVMRRKTNVPAVLVRNANMSRRVLMQPRPAGGTLQAQGVTFKDGTVQPEDVVEIPALDETMVAQVGAGTPLSVELQAKARFLFDQMDEHHSGKLTREDARHYFRNFGDVSEKALFNEVDHKASDLITWEEFLKFWEQVKRQGYTEAELDVELDELLTGQSWVHHKDSKGMKESHDYKYYGAPQ